jgi:Zn-dependent peptidase ImmA (M78 family)
MARASRIGNVKIHLYNCLLKSEHYKTHWGYYYQFGKKYGTLLINEKTRSNQQWFRILLHELIHSVEHAEGFVLDHELLDKIASGLAQGLTSAKLVDPKAVRRAYEEAAVVD